MDMKKNCFLRLMNVAMMAIMFVTSFTVCGRALQCVDG